MTLSWEKKPITADRSRTRYDNCRVCGWDTAPAGIQKTAFCSPTRNGEKPSSGQENKYLKYFLKIQLMLIPLA
uniref:Uncharacterized protein n=1 Tax=Steinernema glaseri TaxID=37863 RepID=A0A1I7YCV2_9BILA